MSNYDARFPTLTLNAARSYWLQDKVVASAFKIGNGEFADWLKSDRDCEMLMQSSSQSLAFLD